MSTLAESEPQPQKTNPDPPGPVPHTPPLTVLPTGLGHDHDHDHDHAHAHDHGQPLSSNETFEAANVAHFDALGHDFDKRHPDAADFSDQLCPALRRLVVLDENTTSLLDYACGSGQVSRALAPYVAQLVGVDISPRMVEVYNARANEQGLQPHEMRAVCSLAELQQCFDVAVCSMAYHHFASVEDVTRELVAHLKPRGTLAIADIARLEADENEMPILAKYGHIVAHTRGFAEGEIRALFEGAGLENVAFDRFASAKREGRDVQFFLATGTKPAE